MTATRWFRWQCSDEDQLPTHPFLFLHLQLKDDCDKVVVAIDQARRFDAEKKGKNTAARLKGSL